MSFSAEKREHIKFYFLEKLRECPAEAVKKTCDTFGISRNTVYRYIRELEAQNVISRSGNNISLAKSTSSFSFAYKDGLNENNIYDEYIADVVSGYDKNIISIWDYSFSEMMNNALEHSKARNFLIIISRDYLSTAIFIVDDGIGIFENIRMGCGLESLDDAVNELFKGKLTTAKEGHSGEGIFFTSRILDRFFAFSDGKVFTHDKYCDISFDFDSISGKKNVFSKGTCIYMELSNFSNKLLKDVFDMFSDDDGAFCRTIIPLRHIFEKDPMSRSQARKLCFRFDCFEEVILDFCGIEFIGQGFAHEIFVVYQGRHPDLKIVARNANRDIEKMINHVRLS